MGRGDRESGSNKPGSQQPDIDVPVGRPGRSGKPGGSSRSAKRYADVNAPSRDRELPELGELAGVDVAVIEARLRGDFPWLLQLANGSEIVALYTRRLALTQAAEYASDQYRALLEDPVANQKQLARWERARQKAALALRVLPNRTAIELTPLLADQFLAVADLCERAGREAMVRASQRARAAVLLRMPLGGHQVTVYLGSGWLPMRDGRIHFDAFFERNDTTLLAVQAAYHDAKAAYGEGQLSEYVDERSWIAGAVIDGRIAGQRRAAVAEAIDGTGAHPLLEHENAVRAMAQDRRDRAESVRATVASSVAPLVIIAGFFAIEGAGDVFLALFPVGKAAKLVRQLGKGRGARRAQRLLRELAEELDPSEEQFVHLASRLRRADFRAVQQIADVVKKPEVINLLMAQQVKGHANLVWIGRMLKRGAFDSAFVEHFMRYDANPTWNQLRGLMDNTLRGASRDSAVSKLTGFLGEEGAAKHVQSRGFGQRLFRPGERTLVSRGEKFLDLIVRTDDESRLLFGEVKNWSAATWNKPSQQKALLDQLAGHNKTIDKIVEATSRRKIVGKVLLVAERGFAKLSLATRTKLEKQVASLGWRIEVIPGGDIESAGQFLDQLRKGA